MQKEASDSPAPCPNDNITPSEQQKESITYRISFRLLPDRTDPVPLINELHTLGKCSIVARQETIPQPEENNPGHYCEDWYVILTTCQGINVIKDIFIFVEDDCELHIDAIDDGWGSVKNPATKMPETLLLNGVI